MTAMHRVGVAEIVKHFEALEDPRAPINLKHPLSSVIVIAVMAVLAGADGPTAIARWAQCKATFLVTVLDLPNGIPCKDVFRNILMALQPRVFQECFVQWVQALRTQAAQALGIEQPIFAVDGKTLRRSHDHRQGLGALHAVSVWASELGLSLGQVACAEKSNEITAIPEILRLVDIQGAIITIDALGTQKKIAAAIIDRQADYVLAVKGNQEKLEQDVIAYIHQHMENDFVGVDARQHFTHETGHGREEMRSYLQLPVPKDWQQLDLWKGLKSVGMATLCCVRAGKETMETRYYISSLAVGVKRFAHAVRSHWGIENGCHWSLDIIYREDQSRIRDEHLRENFAWLNRLTLSLLKQHPSKDSTIMKRRACGWNEDFLLEVLTGLTP